MHRFWQNLWNILQQQIVLVGQLSGLVGKWSSLVGQWSGLVEQFSEVVEWSSGSRLSIKSCKENWDCSQDSLASPVCLIVYKKSLECVISSSNEIHLRSISSSEIFQNTMFLKVSQIPFLFLVVVTQKWDWKSCLTLTGQYLLKSDLRSSSKSSGYISMYFCNHDC